MLSSGTTLVWPATLTAHADGRVQVRFPDFPEALTDGAHESEAPVEAADCLAEAVAARITDGEDRPQPSPRRRGMHAVPLPPLLAYKAALLSAMPHHRISKSELARRLGIDEKDVRRLIDPRYRGSKIARLHAALAACGVRAQITLVDGDLRGAGARRPARLAGEHRRGLKEAGGQPTWPGGGGGRVLLAFDLGAAIVRRQSRRRSRRGIPCCFPRPMPRQAEPRPAST